MTIRITIEPAPALRFLLLVSLLLCLPACSSADPTEKKFEGILIDHDTGGGKNSHQWYGYRFSVGNTPVLPTDRVNERAISAFVGKRVVVKGVWNPGKKWSPESEGEVASQSPVTHFKEDEKTEVIRGEGLEVYSIDLK